jgi:tetratricopeptide (TPR) repeat protein
MRFPLVLVLAACAAKTPSNHQLTPSTSQVRYRFDSPSQADPRTEIEQAIRDGEMRASRDPIEMTELANLYFVRAQIDGERRDFDAAERLAHESLALLPAPNGAAMTLAKLANARHQFREAIELAHKYQGRNAVAVPMTLATAYLALGELPRAAAAADEAVAAKPTPSTYLERALVRQAQGRDADAAADFANAVRVEDYGDVLESARVRALWARFLVRRGNYESAREVIDEALRLAPGNALAVSIRAELELRTGDAKRARADLEAAFLAQHQVRYMIDQARALEVGGDRVGADKLRRTAEGIVREDLATNGVGHRLELVELLVDRGDPAGIAEAVAVGRDELARRPGAESYYQLARALARDGHMDDANAQVQAAIASGAREPQYYELASRIANRRGDAVSAGFYAQLADAFDPAHGRWRSIGMP